MKEKVQLDDVTILTSQRQVTEATIRMWLFDFIEVKRKNVRPRSHWSLFKGPQAVSMCCDCHRSSPPDGKFNDELHDGFLGMHLKKWKNKLTFDMGRSQGTAEQKKQVMEI